MSEGNLPRRNIPRLKASDRRLLRGYGPAVVIGAAFLLMAILVPTVAPEQNVSAAASSSGSSGITSGGTGSGPSTGGSTSGGSTSGGTSSGGSSGTSVGSSGSGSGSSGGGASTSRSTSPGAQSQVPAGKATTCSGAQVKGDPYSPPCISFTGSNGGATSRGVSANQIVVTYRIPADGVSSVDTAIQDLAGKYNKAEFSDTPADIERTLNDLVTYFNDHFQFYGRKIVLKQFNGQGTLTAEITDGGQAQANADALTVADSIKAFADVSALTQPYSQALSNQHVINIGSPYMSAQYYQQNSPYAYSFFPNCTDLGNESAAIATKELVAQKVAWGGTGVSDGQTRRFAVLAPDNPVYQSCANIVTQAMSKAGHPVVANLSYTLDLSQLSQEAASIEQQIVNDKITTVLCGCDPITLIYLTGDLDNARYDPEFFNIGAAFTDEDLLAQLFDQTSWAHAAGVTNNGDTPPYGSSLGYFAAKSVDPSHAPAQEVDILYEDLYILALGIQLAGPNLTPQNFQQGLFSYGGGTGEYGPWSFNEGGVGTWTPQHAFRYEWWDPNASSSFNKENGTWEVGSNFYTASQVAAGPPPVFPSGPQ